MPTSTALHRPPKSFPMTTFGAQTPPQPGQGAVMDAAQPILSLPFDAMRQHYAGAVIAGLVPRSIRDSGRLERWLGALEALTLGPLARCR